jgi:hypothetical protein
LSRATADAQRASYEPILKAVAGENSNVSYIPVLQRLCGPQMCPMYRPDGLLLYRDGDHLSRRASERMASALEILFGSRRREAPRFEAPPPSATK